MFLENKQNQLFLKLTERLSVCYPLIYNVRHWSGIINLTVNKYVIFTQIMVQCNFVLDAEKMSRSYLSIREIKKKKNENTVG